LFFRKKNHIQNKAFMGHKDIKAIVRKQLKTKFSNEERLDRKVKGQFTKQVLAEVVAEYDLNLTPTTSKDELQLALHQIPGLSNKAHPALPGRNRGRGGWFP
jgi:hypothetical protein